jgi:multiple sugar transport system ATP-binding protein
LTVQEISKSFGSNVVLEKIPFEVADGEFCVLLGPSGCGKSTLLRMIAGLETPSSGTISLGDRRIDGLPPRERDIAFVFQSYALYPHMNVFDNLAFSLRLRGLPQEEIEEKVGKAAGLLEINDLLERKPQELSGGQRQRVALGRAIVRQPKIFLFDEPLSNLDASLRASMRVELALLHKRLRATILYVTHDQAEAMTLGDKIIVLNEGKVQQIDIPAIIYRKPANTFVARFVGSPPMNLIEGKMEDNGLFRFGTSSIDLSNQLPAGKEPPKGEAVTLGVRPEDLQPAEPGQAFIHCVVDVVEDLGSDRFIHLRSENIPLIARIPTDILVQSGEEVHLSAKPERLHLFYQGNRIN